MNKGFIALTIVLSVAGTMLGLVGSASLNAFAFFDMATRKEYREMNYHNAGNCIDQAILSLAHDFFYTVTEPQYIPHFNCSILSITAEGDVRNIKTRGDFQKVHVFRSVTVRLKNDGLDVVKIE
jgi:hypothetical protein